MSHALTLAFALVAAHTLAPTTVPDGGGKQPPARLITVDEALQIASSAHPDVLAAEHAWRSARAQAKSSRGRLLPRLDVMDMQQWARTQTAIDPNVLPGFNPQALADAPQKVMANILAVSVSQPLLGLLHTGAEFQANTATAHAQGHTLDATRASLRCAVQSNLIALFKARALTRTAIASQQSLEEQVEDARQEADAGVLARTDVLRMEAAAAQAKQQVIASQAQAESIYAELLEALDLGGAAADIDFVEPQLPQLDIKAVAALPSLRGQALEQRPELRAHALLAHAAHKRARAKTWSLLPEISAQGTYGHVVGKPLGLRNAQGDLQLNAYVFMLSGKWAVWEWGASVYAEQQARHDSHAARARAESARRLVGAEVAAKHAQLLAQSSAIHVAQAQVDSAEEAFRVMQASRAAGSATTTDLLQAEAARTQARMNLISARYDTHLAHVALKRALGADTVEPTQG